MGALHKQLILSSLRRGREVKLKVFGKSMGSILPSGTKAEIFPAKFEELKNGDIVLIKSQGGLALHWLVFKARNWGLTWGGGNLFFDGRIASKNFLGRLKKNKSFRLDLYPKLCLVLLLTLGRKILRRSRELKREFLSRGK